MPTHATRLCMALFLLHAESGFPPSGDLDDPEAADWVGILAPDGLDQPYHPSTDPFEDNGFGEDEPRRWEEWQGYAKARGLPMTTYRHIFEFMLELGLIERREDPNGVIWLNASPLQQVDEVLPLPPERQARLAERRWRETFLEKERQIIDWLQQLRTPDAESIEFETSIRALAEQVGLGSEDTRHALALLLNEDVQCDLDPETAAVDAPLRITIDWQLFEDFRTVYRAAPMAEEEFGSKKDAG